MITSAENIAGDPTGQACKAFGGCPYQSRCSTWARLQHAPAMPAPSGGTMGLLDRVAGSAAATPTAPPAPASAPGTGAPEPAEMRSGPAESIELGGGSRPQLALYIDCEPLPCGDGELLEVTRLEQYLPPLVDEVCRRANVPHYSFIDGWQGKGQVAALLECNLPTGHVVVDSRLPLSPMCIEVLVRHATSLVRGAR